MSVIKEKYRSKIGPLHLVQAMITSSIGKRKYKRCLGTLYCSAQSTYFTPSNPVFFQLAASFVWKLELLRTEIGVNIFCRY